MRKLLWLLLIPISVNARVNLSTSIECQEELAIGENISCKLVIDNPAKSQIKGVSFAQNSSLLNIKLEYELKQEEDIYNIALDSSDEKIDLFAFNFLMEKNNTNVSIENIKINTDIEEISQNVGKTLAIKNIAYADQIYINNTPIEIKRDIYNYTINIYERTEYIEIKTITSGQNKTVNGEVTLIKYTPNIAIKVTNESDTETYNITLNYKNPNTVSNITIEEIPFKFNPNKKNYYLEVENSVYKVTMGNGDVTKDFLLNVGKNSINFENNDEVYNFIIKRLRTNETVNNDSKLKTLKIGNTYLNLKDDVYEYDYVADKVDVVTIETDKNQDYEIKYSSNKVRVIVYDAKLNSSEYVINLVDDTTTEKEVKEYDNSKNIVIFLIFLLLFILVLLFVIKKHKKERVD